MRKSINGLSALAERIMLLSPFEGDVFAFCNRKENVIKILFWERNGFCIWHKRLEKDRFPWPQSEAEALEMTEEQLCWLLDGVDFRRAHGEIKYTRAT